MSAESVPLSLAQEQMLRRAARSRNGETFVGRGQSKTAKRLVEFGLGRMYQPDAYSVRFVVYDVERWRDPDSPSSGHREAP